MRMGLMNNKLNTEKNINVDSLACFFAIILKKESKICLLVMNEKSIGLLDNKSDIFSVVVEISKGICDNYIFIICKNNDTYECKFNEQ